MLQVRSILDVADNTGAKRAAAIGVLGRNQRYAHVGDIIKAHIKEAAPDGTVMHVKKGDDVVVIAGADKGKRGRVISVSPKKGRVIVEGARMIKRHTRKSQQHPQGAIVEREGTLHISNVMKADKFDARAAKHGPATPAPA